MNEQMNEWEVGKVSCECHSAIIPRTQHDLQGLQHPNLTDSLTFTLRLLITPGLNHFTATLTV